MEYQNSKEQNETMPNCGKCPIALEELSKVVAGWVNENFANALCLFNERKSTFKFVRVEQISKAWWRECDGVMIVSALIRYSFVKEEVRAIELQINEQKQVLGFDLFEPIQM